MVFWVRWSELEEEVERVLELDEGLLDVEVCAGRLRAAASSAVAPQAIHLPEVFMGVCCRFLNADPGCTAHRK